MDLSSTHHPTNTGCGIVANAFIKELNRTFAAGIPPPQWNKSRRPIRWSWQTLVVRPPAWPHQP
jgi:hypothetical protein